MRFGGANGDGDNPIDGSGGGGGSEKRQGVHFMTMTGQAIRGYCTAICYND
jgi:hypothetical protein